jgi:hypothetical protein
MAKKSLVAFGMLVVAQVAWAQVTMNEIKLVGAGTTGIGQHVFHRAYSVALSADGTTALVGGAGVSAARVFTRSDAAWSQQASIPLGSDAVAGGRGFSVAISGDGNTAIVGGALTDDDLVGGAWVYTRSGGEWTQQGPRLVGTDGPRRMSEGYAVAISADGTTAIVGAPWTDDGVGAARVYTRSGGVWAQQGPKLVGSGALGPANQGYSVALSANGNTAIVGGPFDNASWEGEGMGAAWVYTRSGEVWTQQGGKLIGAGPEGQDFPDFGDSVALSADGSTAISGGPWDGSGVGGGWVFTRSGGQWSQQGIKLVGSGAIVGAAQGYSVAISGDGNTAVIGGPWDDSKAGAVWVFTNSDGSWMQKGAKLVGGGAVGSASQGASVAIAADGKTLLIGGPDDGDTGAAWAHSIFLTQSLWVPVATHDAGLNHSQWRSDLGLLNTGFATANVQVRFHSRNGVVSSSTYVPAGVQSILSDVVGQLGASGQGSLEVITDRELKITVRTYNLAGPDSGCFPNSTQGQNYPVIEAGDGLEAGDSAYLPALVENAAYRCNIGVVNTGDVSAKVLIELYNGAGAKLNEYTLLLTPGQWAQKNQPFKSIAGETAMDRGYAKVTVQSGTGVFALASIIDNVTNDPTAVAMQR